MKSHDLLPFVPPVVEKPKCASCEVFQPEVLVPMGEGSLSMCWLCAHHVVEHNTSVQHARVGQCECSLEEIYPQRVLEARNSYAPSKFAGAFHVLTDVKWVESRTVPPADVAAREAGYRAPLPTAFAREAAKQPIFKRWGRRS